MLAAMKLPKAFLKAVTLCLVLVAGIAVSRQQNKETEQDDKASATEQKNQSTDKTNDKVKKNNERFVPTEEISEDLPVAFPVDI